MDALLRYPKHERRAVAQRWAHRSNIVQAQSRLERDPDFETIRYRGLENRRGKVVNTGFSYIGGERKEWKVIHSLRGRTDQFDVVVGGQVLFTGGRRNIRAKYGLKIA